MNTREENVEALMREAEESVEQQERRCAERDWARRWEAGDARCPRCKGAEFVRGNVQHEGLTCYETYVCNQESCKACWRLELRATALLIDEEEDDEEWIDLRPLNASPAVALTERERAPAGSSPTRQPQMSEPQRFQIVIEDGVVTGVRVSGAAAARGAQPLFTVREYESDGSLDADHLTGFDENNCAYYEHEVPVWDGLGATDLDAELGATFNADVWDLDWEDISVSAEAPRSRLLATVRIAGVPHHMEAIEVLSMPGRPQQAASAAGEEILERYRAAEPEGGLFRTVECGNRAYALFVTPFRY